MRVLITNSLVLAAISLVPSASAAPYTTTSSVDSYDSYPNSTVLAQESGPSSVPSMLYPYRHTLNLSRSRPALPLDVRRDEIIHVQSLYDGSPFGNVFGPVADLFGTIGMNTISDSIPLTEAQKTVLDQLHDALNGATSNVIAHLPATHLLSPLSSRSLEDHQVPNPLATLGSLPVLGDTLAPVLDFLSSVEIGTDPTATLTDDQKLLIAKLRTAIHDAVATVTSTARGAIAVISKPRSLEERSLEDVMAIINQVPILSSALSPVTTLIHSLGFTNGLPPDDVQKLALARLQAEIAKVTQNIEASLPSVHIEHTREEHEHWDHHHHHGSHREEHDSHDSHKDHDKSWDEHKGHGKSWGERKDDDRSRDVRKDYNKPHDTHEDGHKSPDVHKDDDHNPQNANQAGDRCREPRDGQWGDCRHFKDGKDRDEDPSLLKISLGHAHHP